MKSRSNSLGLVVVLVASLGLHAGLASGESLPMRLASYYPLMAANASSLLAEPCEQLPQVNFTRVQDAPTQVMSSRMVRATAGVPTHCRAEGYVAPNVGFLIWLPDRGDWNGNFLQASPGGYGGNAMTEEELTPWCEQGLRRGYACLAHNTGHVGIGSKASWGYNDLQAQFDYGIRGHHVVDLAGKALTEHYYRTPPKYSYHVGCSGGGKQGLTAANRHPWNFDGILAIEPSNVTATGVMLLWNALVTHDKNHNPLFSKQDLQVLHQGAIAACDADDRL